MGEMTGREQRADDTALSPGKECTAADYRN